jgi:hypothetical protein
MRYPKGSLQLNESRDVPLLRQILHSEFVSHSQLFEFARLNHYEISRKSFDWRIRRLVEGQLATRQTVPGCIGGFVYSVAGNGAVLLQGTGEYCLVGRGKFTGKETERSAFHALELNEIQLSALRAELLVRWISSMEIRSQNELTRFGFAKDYDAVVTVRVGLGESKFALEYERSPKPQRYYSRIATALERETHISHVLYLVSNYDLLQFVASFLRNSRCQVFFGLVKDWHVQLLDMPVLSNATTRRVRFSDSLAQAAEPFEPDAIAR